MKNFIICLGLVLSLPFLAAGPAQQALLSVKTPSGGGGGGPTMVSSDNFDAYANAADLGSQTNWATVNGAVGVDKPGSDSRVGGNAQSAARRTDSFNADHRSVATCDTLPGAFSFVSVQVRCQSGADTRYWFQTDGTNWYLVVRVAGSQTVLAFGTQSISVGERIALNAVGTSTATRLTAQYYSGGSWTNVTGAVSIDPGTGNYIDGGTPGVGGDGATALADDWEGWNL